MNDTKADTNTHLDALNQAVGRMETAVARQAEAIERLALVLAELAPLVERWAAFKDAS